MFQQFDIAFLLQKQKIHIFWETIVGIFFIVCFSGDVVYFVFCIFAQLSLVSDHSYSNTYFSLFLSSLQQLSRVSLHEIGEDRC